MNLCQNCVHHHRPRFRSTTFCKRTETTVINPVNGERYSLGMMSCENERMFFDCGIDGRFFEAKPVEEKKGWRSWFRSKK